jgi:glucose-1-phosphate adenylyltransferase
VDLLTADANDPKSQHDFSKDILPKLAGNAPIYAYSFQTNSIRGEPENSIPYWRDVGTIDAYYEANMGLRSVKPELNLLDADRGRGWHVTHSGIVVISGERNAVPVAALVV